MREVHDFVADVIRRGQEPAGSCADRDPDAEAWIFLAGGLLAHDRPTGSAASSATSLERVAASGRQPG